MELRYSFTVPVPIEEAWQLLLDLERIVPALPGASLTNFDADSFTGQVKIKIGSIQLVYKGAGKFIERDETRHRMAIEAAGKDARGAGTASATIGCVLTPDGEGTRAEVTTDLALTGKPAQFGRGLINDVSTKILDQFAKNLSAALQAPAETEVVQQDTPGAVGQAPTEPHTLRQDVAGETGRPTTAAPRVAPLPEAQPLDLMDVAGGAIAKRVAGAVVAVVVIALTIRVLRRSLAG